MVRRSVWSLAGLLIFCSPAAAAHLTFQDRVRAEEALARVRYAQQVGATAPFEEAVPREVLEQRVREALAYSRALERLWHNRITGNALAREVARQVRDSLDPEALRAMHEAL